MQLRPTGFALLAVLLSLALPARAGVDVVFTQDEITIIQGYYAHQGAADQGNGKKSKGKPLPPGIAKNLARGKPLPPGIAKQQLPGDLVRQLPPVPQGYERVYVDGRVLLVDIATQIISDVLTAAVFH
jgi:hypothetical protein